MSTKCAAKKNSHGLLTVPGSSGALGVSLEIQPPGAFSQACHQHTGCIRRYSFIRWKESFVMNTHKWNCLPVSVTKPYKISGIWRKEKNLYSSYFSPYIIYIGSLVGKKYLSDCQNLFKPSTHRCAGRCSARLCAATASTNWFAAITDMLRCSQEPRLGIWTLYSEVKSTKGILRNQPLPENMRIFRTVFIDYWRVQNSYLQELLLTSLSQFCPRHLHSPNFPLYNSALFFKLPGLS